MRYTEIPNTYENYGIPYRRSLSVIAEMYPFGAENSPRELILGELPKVFHLESGRNKIETSFYFNERSDNSKRGICYGNDHGLIFPFLAMAVRRGVCNIPVESIVNFDYHADIAPYDENAIAFTANWQRLGVDQQFWTAGNSFNIQPDDSEAPANKNWFPQNYIKSVKAEDVTRLRPTVLSIDLDFYRGMSIEKTIFYTDILAGLAKKAALVCIFASPEWWNAKDMDGELFLNTIASIHNSFSDVPS